MNAHVAIGDPKAARRPTWAVVAAAVMLEALVVGLWSAHRGINADEGFYLAAARAVASGQRIYADFFFPQMPYLPWLDGAFFRLADPSLGLARLVNVAGAALSAGVLVALVVRLGASSGVAVLVGFLYAASAVPLNSYAVVKTTALTNLFLLAAFGLLVTARVPHWTRTLLAGMAAAMAVGLRLPAAPAALLLAGLAARGGLGALLAYAGGGALASLPWLVVAVRHPEEFWFCNVAFHGLRREVAGAPAILLQKLAVVAKWFLLPQHAVLWGLAGYGVWRAPRQTWPAVACALVLAFTYLAATPTYLEYATQFLPFLLIAAIPALTVLAPRRAFAVVLVASYVLGLYPLLKRDPAHTDIGAKRTLWSRSTVTEVRAFLQQRTAPGEPVLSWWEGYPVLSQRPGFRGVGFWESNVAKKLDPASARRFHVMRRDELRELIRRREPAAIVVADGNWEALRGDIAAGYAPAHRVGAVQIYTRRPAG